MEVIQATCVVLDGRGVLLRGPSGSGKSDLALRLIDRGALLVSDDLVGLEAEADRLRGHFPINDRDLRGVLEVRGLGLIRVAFAEEITIDLVVDLGAEIDRLPERRTTDLLGIIIPWMALDAFEAGAVVKIRAALFCETVDG
jgi:serine kinase of HPr protein (carbohydrate metabolism regulator)